MTNKIAAVALALCCNLASIATPDIALATSMRDGAQEHANYITSAVIESNTAASIANEHDSQRSTKWPATCFDAAHERRRSVNNAMATVAYANVTYFELQALYNTSHDVAQASCVNAFDRFRVAGLFEEVLPIPKRVLTLPSRRLGEDPNGEWRPLTNDSRSNQNSAPTQRTKLDEQVLRSMHLYDGQVDGVPNVELTQGLLNFQDTENLERSGRFDAATRERLYQRAADVDSVRALNERGSKTGNLIVLLEAQRHAGSNKIYRASAGGQWLSLESLHQLDATLQQAANARGFSRVYIKPASMTPDELRALILSINSVNRGNPDKPALLLRDDALRTPLGDDSVLARSVRSVSFDGEGPQPVSGGYTIAGKVGDAAGTLHAITVFSTSRVLVQKLVEHIKVVYYQFVVNRSPGVLAELSAADLVAVAIARLAAEQGTTAAELSQHLSVNFDNLEMAFRERRVAWAR